MTDKLARSSKSEIILYQTEDGRTTINVRLEDEMVWLTQVGMAELLQTSVPNASMHLRNIFHEGELHPESVVKDYFTLPPTGPKEDTVL